MLIQLLTLLCILLYGAGIFFLNRRLHAPSVYTRRILISNIGAVVVHTTLLTALLAERGLNHLSFLIVLSIIALLLGIFSVSRGRQLASLMLRPAIFGFAIVSILLLMLIPERSHMQYAMSIGLTVHIILSLLAFSLLVLASLYAGQVLFLNKVLKERSARALDAHLPPLLAVEQYFFRLLTAGTLVLTCAIVAGVLFVDGLFAATQLHKTILSFVAWLCFGGIVIAHYVRGLRGKPIILLTLTASSLLTLAYFGSRFVRDILLS
ncbi:ABC transporter permease [Aliidiomarina taiwanensis]|uniref:ABC transporter permease n=1 Tax=Aliidiomarina taiwanensis TaxID=946228 RepID=A0A432X1X1_9GAMM|nr:ABC transporter permease [Aliidiomarina taiwanensis]